MHSYSLRTQTMCLIRTHQHLLGSLGDLQLHDPWHSSTQHPAARGSVLLVGEPAPPFLYASRIFWAQLYLASWEHITRFAGRMEIQGSVKQKDKNHLGLLLSNTELHQNLFKLNLSVSTSFFFLNWRRKYRKNMYFQLSVGHPESPHQPAWHRRQRTTSRLVCMRQVWLAQ